MYLGFADLQFIAVKSNATLTSYYFQREGSKLKSLVRLIWRVTLKICYLLIEELWPGSYLISFECAKTFSTYGLLFPN
nr:hypothetical protein CFP56_39436 [Quercus suber]